MFVIRPVPRQASARLRGTSDAAVTVLRAASTEHDRSRFGPGPACWSGHRAAGPPAGQSVTVRVSHSYKRFAS